MSKKSVTVVVVGNVDSGKSSIIKQLWVKSPKNTDPSTQDLEREETWTYRITYMATFLYSFALIDTPGQSKFTKNIISGVSVADAGVVVISAGTGEYEAGRERVKDLILFLFVLNVRQIIIVINKMDDINWSEERYNIIVEETNTILKRTGYHQNISFIPTSAWTGDNITEPTLNEWYKGPTLLSSLNLLSLPLPSILSSLSSQPFRMTVARVLLICGIGTIIIGKVITGMIKETTRVSLSPSIFGYIRSIQKNNEFVGGASPGDFIGIHVVHVSRFNYWKGMLLGDQEYPPRLCESFIVQLLIISSLPSIIRVGYSPVIFCHSSSTTCTFAEILETRDKRTGKVIEEKPERIKEGDCALVKLVPNKSLSLECFSYFPSLGKIIVYDSRPIATGLVMEVNYKKD